MTDIHLERMRALVAQAAAEAANLNSHQLAEIQLDIYGQTDDTRVEALFIEASKGSEIEGVPLVVSPAGSRYICWNCCGLRFESEDGICANCGEVGLEIPEEIAFSLRRVVAV